MSKEEQYDYALLNSAMYDPNPQSVLDKVERGRKYTIIEESVNDMVIRNNENNKFILVIKGTDISDKKGMKKSDLIQDLGILLNNKDMVTRTKEMENKTEKLIKKYGKENIVLTGHSLAGYIVSEISGDLNVPAVAFNTGSSPFNRNRNNRVKGNNSTTHYTTNTGSNFDPVSLTAARVDNYNRIQVEPNQEIGTGILKYHTIEHFLENSDLEKIKKNNNLDNNKIMDKSSFENKEKTKNARKRQKFYMRKAIAKELKIPASTLKGTSTERGKTYEELRDIIEKNQLQGVMETIRRADKLLDDDDDDDEEEVKGVMGDMIDIVEQAEEPPDVLTFEEENLRNNYNKRKQELKKKGYDVYYPDDPKMPRLLSNRNSDNFIRGVNSYTSFQTNPNIPARSRFTNIPRQIENIPIRYDPDPRTYPEQSLIGQNDILEGEEEFMPEGDAESSRGQIALAQNNMFSHAQRQMLAETRVRTRRRGEGDDDPDDPDDEFGFDYEEKDEDDEKYDRAEENLFEGDDINNRQRNEKQLEILSYRDTGKWSGSRGVSSDYQRSAVANKKDNYMKNSGMVNALRAQEIPWKKPSRTSANNNISLMRNSNRSMTLQVNQLLP
tara:strand:+ start:278 stop:2107 length:1830 start_codon:yes stop_codon:yes gene_type:complete